ncbi:MAG: carboxypeptidase regulatory-like domain-containing protein [Gemmatimonadaceae bacterium]
MLQIDALSYAELRRAIELGYCPTISKMVREERYTLRRWFCGLPSATPYCQAGIFYGENECIPAFRFYDKKERRIITCNTPSGVQYIRDRIHAPGALAGGSSYVNLLDGDASTVALTVATRERLSVFKRLGGWRMALLLLIHPIRLARMGVQAVLEWLREEYERTVGELGRKRTHSEGLFPFVRILSNVIVREIQTMAIVLDIYLGVPIIYSTYMQYDELGHHFGPSSFQALRDLRRTDARIREIRRMIESADRRDYDLVLVSDHGMTPSSSYRVLFNETLGRTIEHILDRDAARTGEHALRATESFARTSEYADMGPQVVDAVTQVAPDSPKPLRHLLGGFRDWLRSKYGIRELILPEKYRVEEDHDVVVTYSSCLALLYFADRPERLDLSDIRSDSRRQHLYDELLRHPGVGLLAARLGSSIHLESTTGRAVITDGRLEVLKGTNPLDRYESNELVVKAVEHLVRQENTGDLTIVGAYDGYEIVSFDDQIGAHGAVGGNQLHPFLIGPEHLNLDAARLEDARDIHKSLMTRYAASALAFLIALAPVTRAQQQAAVTGVVAGRVIDAVTAEPRAGTSVSVVGSSLGAIVGADGRFTIAGVAFGDRTVRARLFGFKTVEQRVVVRAGDTTRVDFKLETEAALLGAVKTQARPVDRDLFDNRPGVGTVQMTAHAAEGVPKFGEPDVLRIVQLLPGVEARNDFSTGLNVRGGESDQNLILIDGYPIYNPFHVGGLFSTFIDPTVADVTLMTGGFPARYGGRLSAVLDVRSAEDVQSGIHGTEELSVLASTLEFGGAFDHGKGSWMIAGRRTYADKFVDLISTQKLPYHFRDEQAHFAYSFTPSTKLSFTVYDGRDDLNASVAQFGDSTNNDPSGGQFEFGWGNAVLGATLTHTRANDNPNVFSRFFLGELTTFEQQVSVSHFSTLLDLGAGSLTLTNSVADTRAAGSVTAHTSSHDRTFGYDIGAYRINYDAGSLQAGTSLFTLKQNPTSAAVYVDDMWRVHPRFLLETGLRGDGITGRRWSDVEPRVSAKFFLTKDFALTGAVGEFSQWTHSLSREDIPIRLFDFWVASDAATPVSTAWHYILGVERWMTPTRYVRVETFYKKYKNLLEANPQADPSTPGDEFNVVQGDSYGADLLLRQFESGPFSGWISYTYAVATRELDGVRYYPGHDRRHDLNIVASWRLKKYLLGMRFGYATGTPYTDIVGEIVRRVYDPGQNDFGTRGSGSQTEFIGGPRNGARLPSTQRLDLNVTRTYTVGKTTIAPFLSVVNSYNAKNVFIYIFDYSKNPPTRQAISQFPFLPSAGVAIHF